MKVLAMDSATDACSVALCIGDKVWERFEIAPRSHTKLLLPMTHELLAAAGLTLRELDLFGLTLGPGSFTGLRISFGLIQGLAQGLDRPVVGMSSLAALASRTLRLHGHGQVAVAMDARMGQVYWGEYALTESGHCQALKPDCLLDPEHAPRLHTGHWHAAGLAWQRYPGLVRATGLTLNMEKIEQYPHAEEVVRMATHETTRGQRISAISAQPIYLRQQVAEKMKKRD